MRLHITLDEETVNAVDEVAGTRGRSRFIREAIEQQIERQRRMAALEKVAGSIPDYAPQMTAETISAERKRHTQLRDEKLRRHRDRG